MKLVIKQMLMTAAVVLFATPVVAAEGPTKGTKSYQAARSEAPDRQTQNTAATTTADDVAQIAPAAGDTAEAQDAGEKVKTLREEMKLPRKH